MNIAVTNVSLIFFNRKTQSLVHRNYEDEEGNLYDGVMTNEAPLKSLIKRMSARGERLDRIIYIESNAVRKEKEITGYGVYTHADFLRVRIAENLTGNLPQYDKEKDSIYIEDEPDELAVSKTIFAVYDRMTELYKEVQRSADDKELNVYIEANGGVRYVLTMLLSIMRTLENSLDHFHIKEMSSMVASHDEDAPIEIKNTKAIYDTSQITSIIEEYVNYGRINGLKKYAKNLFMNSDMKIKKDVEETLGKLENLAQDIQLCRTKMMLDDFYQDGGVGKKIDDFLNQNKDSNNASIEIFKYILGNIKAEFNEGIYRGADIDGENILYLPKVIKWCLEKDFVQQALTLCSERIPGYLFESKKVELSDELGELLESVNTNKYEKSYYFIANMRHEFLSKMDNAKVQASLNAIKNMDRTRRILSEENWKKIELDTPLPCKGDTRFGVIAEKDKIYQMALSYKNMEEGDIDEENIRRIVISNGFNESILKKEISISKSNTAEILNVFQGKYIDKNGNAAEHPNLKTKEDRLIKILPALIRLFMPTFQGMEEYKQLIDEVFKGESNSFKEALKNKYAKVQSDKYYVREAMLPTFDHIFTNLPGGADDLQRILYLYSMCKEQRNFSNHAHVNDSDRPVAMNARQLKLLINSLLNACEAT